METVPGMLHLLGPGVALGPGRADPAPGDLARLEDDEVDGVPCYRIVWNRGSSVFCFWIEKDCWLLRRTVDQRPTQEVTTDYHPEVDVEIPDELLRFDPPEGAEDP